MMVSVSLFSFYSVYFLFEFRNVGKSNEDDAVF